MPSSIEKLQKFFKLEAERGYDNRAVVGGLDKILPWWTKEARDSGVPSGLIGEIDQRLHEYGQMDPDQRALAVHSLMARLDSAQPEERQDTRPRPVRTDTRAGKQQTASIKQHTAAKAPRNKPSRPSHPLSNDPTAELGLNAPLTVISGIGPKHAQTLKTIDLNTLGDLLYYFPRRYDDYSKLKPINRLEYGDELTIIAGVQSFSTHKIRGSMQISEVVVSDGTDFLRLTFFNQPWITNKLHQGDQIVISGKVDMYLGRLVMNNPEWEPLEQEHLHTNRIVPVYPLAARLTQRSLRRMMFDTVNYWAPRLNDYLPASLRQAAELVDLPTAVHNVHFPETSQQLEAARHRLAFDEIFLLQLGVLRQRFNWKSVEAQVFVTPGEWLTQRQEGLPYSLTGAQQRVLNDICTDLELGRPMNRLLQGDVGSGKTVVATLAIEMVTRHDAQAALMAPTSILAEQHFRTIQKLLPNGEGEQDAALRKEEIRLLVGDTPESEKREIRETLANGSVKLVVGTHALLQDPVEFQRLQLAVIDEQHRFGVEQRAILRAKGENPHLLVMTATPIPRSLALTVYGDLDVSVIDEMPAGRLPVKTHVLRPLERERAYQLIRTQAKNGKQAFIVYPLVEQGDRDEGKAAVEEHERLQREVFRNLRLGLLHGRMKPEEKDQVMVAFRNKEYDILVSTSVVEVGVDVPNATVMLVEGANRFGLAQLHQFRGRVGRGEDPSWCLLIPESENAVENERLAVMSETNDGFVLAERDLDQRGPGDFLGTRQSGYAELKMAKLTDVHLIEKARKFAQEMFEQDPDLADLNHKELEKMLERFWGGIEGDIS